MLLGLFYDKVAIIFMCFSFIHCQKVMNGLTESSEQFLLDTLKSSKQLINFLEESYQLQSHESIMNEFLSNLPNCQEIDLTEWLRKFSGLKNKKSCFARLVFYVHFYLIIQDSFWHIFYGD
jgi:hypothetical protein